MLNKTSWFPIVSVALLVLISALLGIFLALVSRFALLETFLAIMPTTGIVEKTNIAVVGTDRGGGYGRADTIMVVHVNPTSKEARVVSIPRDTRTHIPGRGPDKINHAFAYGGPELIRQTLETLLGVPIPFYVHIDLSGLEKLIDQLGGITVKIEKRMYYMDYAGGFFIDLQPGTQRLTGKQAVGYARFRADAEGDLGRIARQQKLVQAIVQELLAPRLRNTPGLLMDLMSFLDSNLSHREILGLVLALRQAFDLGHVQRLALGGTPEMIGGVFYLEPNDEIAKTIIPH